MSKMVAATTGCIVRLAVISTALVGLSWAQGPTATRTRYLTSLTNTEIEEYLKRNDIIFIPVGDVEVHGGLPTDCEYVGPLAFAQKMAEEAEMLRRSRCK